jgi:hypothetical protein
MNSLLQLGAVVAVFIAVVHSSLGERRVFGPLFLMDNLPLLRRDRAFTRAILRWAWHLTSLAWVGFAAVLWMLSSGEPPSRAMLGRIVALVFGLSGAIAGVSTRGRHIAWPLFMVVALAAWVGVR